MDRPSNLPRILCLHGGGTNATILQIQLRRLVSALREHFTFVFVTAPLESGPGPGVIPAFADCGPYYRWMAPEGEDQAPLQMQVRVLLKNTIVDDGGEFVGVLGFSQGARMAAGLLADQEEGESKGMPEWKFGVLLCGSYPPGSLSASRRPIPEVNGHVMRDTHGETREPDSEEVIRVPTVHMRGLQDIHLEKGRRLSKFFSDKIEFEFDQGHHLPGAAGDTTSPKTATTDLANAVLTQYGVEVPAKNHESRPLKTSQPEANGIGPSRELAH